MLLNNHTYYSLHYGTLSPEELVAEGKRVGAEAMALTDINNTSAIFDFVKECRQAGIRPVAGIEFRTGDRLLYTALARNREGFRELNEFLSHHNLTNTPLPPTPPAFENAWVIYPFGRRPATGLNDHEWIGVAPPQISRLVQAGRETRRMVVMHSVTFRHPSDHFIHKNLRAIEHNLLISRLQPPQMAAPGETMLPPARLRERFAPWPEIIRNTETVLDSCSFEFDFTTCKNKKTFTGDAAGDRQLLEKLARDGLEYRYGKNHTEAARRVEHELGIIHRLGFSSYFLIAWDIIRYSMSRGFYHVGRGSGANSVVAYCLKITDVDPIELNLYFERFINPKRTSPPDFDIDYSWKERDEVLDYIFLRHGRNHTALLGTTSTFRSRSILRELGKVYGLPADEIDALADAPGNEESQDHIAGKIMRIGRRIIDFPNLRSIHAGGVLISEEPITCYTALDLPPKGYPTTQWDMYVAEDIGFEKLDILSQRGIGHIRDCAEIVRKNRGIRIDVHDVARFKNDPRVKSQLKSGKTIGCFYIESPAMRGLLRKLQCNTYTALVAASSIIRPGVSRSGMMKAYIHRFHHPGDFSYIHPVMKEQLSETYGIMVYQEDVLKVCHHFAGLDLADADVLRRAMSGKYRSKQEFQKIRDRFFDGCREKGRPEETAREVWRQIESFAGYSFSKAHSASYAVESFQSLYLKAHFPLEFMVAVINNFGGFYRTRVYVNEAARAGARIELPCVNHSEYLTTIAGETIYLGFVHLQNLEHRLGKAIPEMRERYGPYLDLEDFIHRVQPGLEQLILLIRINGFRFTGKSKQELLWEAHLLVRHEPATPAPTLFYTSPKSYTLPALEQSRLEDAWDEIELLGFPVTLNDFDLLKIRSRGEATAATLLQHTGQTIRMVGNLVTTKYVRTVKKEVMYFGTFLDARGDFFDTVHFPSSLKKYPFRGKGLYLMLGKVVEEFGFPSLEVQKMVKLPVKEDPRYTS
ncbi:MAG TPA: DNA polymerase III subunit alpha [Bacteroidetes bacterium]|nr:DNA polymerase III subunit alpha [Bacteroidota bacterium]